MDKCLFHHTLVNWEAKRLQAKYVLYEKVVWMNKPPLYNNFDDPDEAVIKSLAAMTKSTSDSEGMV